MIRGVKVVVDSASYLPAAVRSEFGILVVPMRVVLDGQDFREFVDLDAPTFYSRLSGGASVSTSQPSPGDFALAYAAAAAEGAREILSIHIGAALSGTVNSARLGARFSSVPVRIVDTGQASFIEGLAAWAASETLSDGGTVADAEEAALGAAANCGNVFIVRGLDLLTRGGRYAASDAAGSTKGVPVLALVDGAVRPIGSVDSVDAAMEAMLHHMERSVRPGARLRVGIANGAADQLAADLQRRVAQSDLAGSIVDLVQYEIGPAVGAHTGAGCTGLVFQQLP